jgi:cysteine desulfurase / selenocysteine lyase
MNLAEFKSQFFYSPDHCNFNNAGHAQIPLVYKNTLKDWLERMHREGALMSMAGWIEVEKARAQLAQFLGADAEETSLQLTTASALSQAAFGIPLQAGDEILTWDQEYPSNFYPWRVAAERSHAKVIQVASDNFNTPVENILNKMTEKTKVIAVSWVQYQTGAVTDLKKLSEAVKGKNIWLVADVIQGVGVRPFNFHDCGFDIICGGSHKWLCASFGAGFMLVKKERILQLTPIEVGAMTYGNPDTLKSFTLEPKTTAHRFEPGSKAMLEVIAMGEVASLLQSVGIENIFAEACRLANLLRVGLKQHGYSLNCVSGPIINFTGVDIPLIEKKLTEARIAYVKRGPGIRISTHAYNRDEEINYFFKVLDS